MPFLILVLAVLALTIIPGLWVQAVINRYRKPANRYPRTGGQTARHLLDTLGLRPGVRVEVKEKHPFDGPLVLRVDGKVRTLGATVANQVYVQKSA